MRLAVLVLGSVLVACAPVAAPAAVVSPAQPDVSSAQTAAVPRVPEERTSPVAAGFVRPLARMEDDYEDLAGSAARSSGLPAFSGKLAGWPIVGRVTSPFGPRWGGFHTGLDIAAPFNTPVRAAAAGQVMVVGKPYLAYGDTATIVIIAHGSDMATAYVHLTDDQPPVVKVGQRVKAGEVIAFCGSTGFSTGPHLHFMTIVAGRMVDPIPYLP